MSAIYKIIDKKKLDIVKRPISKAHGLPNECYTSKDYTCLLYTSDAADEE